MNDDILRYRGMNLLSLKHRTAGIEADLVNAISRKIGLAQLYFGMLH
jgi:hypothetical protein